MILIGRGLDLRIVCGVKRERSGVARSSKEAKGPRACAVLKVRGLRSRSESGGKGKKSGRLRNSRKPNPEPNKISGDNSLRDPPVPIPNTEVKPQHADSTWLETAR